MPKSKTFTEEFIHKEWDILDIASQSIKRYVKERNKIGKVSHETKLSSEQGKLEFISQYQDQYLENSTTMDEVLKTSDFGNSSSYSDYDDSSYHEADEGQVSEKEKVPAFYRNSMHNAS